MVDVSATQQAQQQVDRSAELANLILDNMLDAIVTTDRDGVIMYANSVTSTLFGYNPSELVGQNINILLPRQQRAAHDRYIHEYHQHGKQRVIGHNRRLEAVDKQGNTLPIELRVCELKSHPNFQFMGAIRDLRPTLSTTQKIEAMQHQDSATGLLNRDGLIQALAQALNVCITDAPQHFALISVDIDDFHLINEGFGIEAGDLVIKEVGRRFSGFNTLACARIHKDEFALLIEGRKDTQHLSELINRLRSKAEAPVCIAGKPISFRFSAGACLFDSTHTASASELVHQSQSALGVAKAEARGELWLYDPLVSEGSKQSALIDQKLKSTGFLDELYLVFQPQFNRHRELVGYEALVRWAHQGQQIYPDEFIPIAERNGAIIDIGDWLVEEACRFLSNDGAKGLSADKRLSINISPKQFQHPHFVDKIKQAISFYQVDAKRLHLELTERLLIESVVDVVEKMHALNRIGITFSLDDFGTGYSSLSYLSKLPLSELKIDKSFVTNLQPSTSNYQIVEAIISLARSLGLNVIAEGVETEKEYALLEQLGCHCYQGYLFAKPVTLAALKLAESEAE